MFQNLAKGAHLIILDMGDHVTVTDGIVENISQPHPKDAQPSQVLQALAFGQQQEAVVDIVVSTPAGQRTFRNAPATGAVDRGGSTIITESRELMDIEVQNLDKLSEEHIAKTPWHEKARKDYDTIRKQLSPQYAHDQERDATIENLKAQYGELKEQNADIQKTQKEILALLQNKA
ncbi:MAG: hypothetical protein K6A96_10870 [Prevotella sp.]|nr:hypothetical protein [Prevotella sp.]